MPLLRGRVPDAGVVGAPTGADQPRVDARKVRSQAYSAMLAGAVAPQHAPWNEAPVGAPKTP